MSKMKNYMMDIEEKIFAIEGIEEKVSESEHISEVKEFVVDNLGLTSSFDISIANELVGDVWNEFWDNYV
tara:strand:- start:8 stop:217 length:210 start_codon:yes stop_codon:yes gene_type:complete